MRNIRETKEQLIQKLAEMRRRIAQLEVIDMEQKQTEEALRQSRLVLQAITDGIAVTDLNGIITEVNERILQIYGLSSDTELLGKNMLNLVAPKEREKFMHYIERTLEHGPTGPHECMFMRTGGSMFFGEIGISIINNASGNPNKLVVVIRDITERKKAEEAIVQDWTRTRKHLDLVGIVIAAVDANGKVSFVNSKGCEVIGYNEEEIVGRNWIDDFVAEGHRDEVKTVHKKLLAGQIESAKYHETPIMTRSGESRIIAWHNTILKDEAGNASGILCSGEDITERQRLLRKMLEYEELNKLKSSLLSTVSHELRTPLATIKGYTTMLLDYDKRLEHGEKRQCLQSIDRATDRLTDLVSHLLDMSRLEAGLLRLEKKPTSIRELVKKAVADIRFRYRKHNMMLKMGKNLPKVNIDEGRIRQVLDNLIDNACKYSSEGTNVFISVVRKNQELIIGVADQGIGIPSDEISEVFTPMYRSKHGLGSRVSGMGLGLAISKGLVESHGGHLWVDSKLGEGSKFYFTIPLETFAASNDDEEEDSN